MSVSSLPEANAFLSGSSLWIIRNDPSLMWWKKIDLNSKYLLSQNLMRKKNKIDSNMNYTLLGSEDHFLNKWVLVWNDLSESKLIDLIEKVTIDLQATSIRFFSDSKIMASLEVRLEARLSASSISISYIENT